MPTVAPGMEKRHDLATQVTRQIRPLGETDLVEKTVNCSRYYLFGDYAIEALIYAVGLGGGRHGEIVLVGEVTPEPVAESFGHFLRLYLDSPHEIGVFA